MKEAFEKIIERLEEEALNVMLPDGFRSSCVPLDTIKHIVNQVAEKYRTTMGQVKCDTSFSDGYIKAIDDAIEKFLEYGCFLVKWNPKLSKENLVTDVLRQVKGQAVYNLEKMKQKEIDSVNQVAEEYVGKTDKFGNSEQVCEWKQEDWDTDVFSTKCGNAHMFIDGNPINNNYEFCPYCGKKNKGGGVMSMISEQIERLRHIADCGFSARGYARELYDAARTIEELSTKLASANMERSTAYYNDGWIPCSVDMPKELGRYIVTLKDGRSLEAIYDNISKRFIMYEHEVIAWQPLPEPYKEVEQ